MEVNRLKQQWSTKNKTPQREYPPHAEPALRVRGAVERPGNGEDAENFVKKKFYIAVGDARWIWPLMRFFPALVHFYIDTDYASARKKLGK